jgi:hypothetical protein
MNGLKKILGFLFFFNCFHAFSQNSHLNKLDSLAANMVREFRNDTREELFMQIDKWFFITGEEIHFRVFCLNTFTHKLSRHSRIVYVDLVDDSDQIIQQLLLNNKELKMEGNIPLQKNLHEGYYWLRAFTSEMLHHDSSRICVKPVYVFAQNNKELKIAENSERKQSNETRDSIIPELKFYPEGCSIIEGANSVIAFRCTDQHGNPLEMLGSVKDATDSVVANFKTDLPGMGRFSFFVEEGKKYTAYIKWGGREISFPLPEVNPFAIQLSVIHEDPQFFKVQVSLGDSLYKKNIPTYLLGFSRDSLCFAAWGTDMYQVTIPKDNFPLGMGTLMLFNEKKQMVSMRHIYIERKDIHFTLHADKQYYGPREKVKLNIRVGDFKDRPLLSLLSISVTDDSLVKELPIPDYLNTLKNDNVELPKYFDADSLFTGYSNEQRDLIMLTQRGDFKNQRLSDHVTNDTDSSISGLKGKIFDKKGHPQKDRIVTLYCFKNMMVFENDTTKESGHFYFQLPEYPDSTEFSIQVTNFKGILQDDKIILDTFAFPRFKTPAQLKKRFNKEQVEVLNNFKESDLESTRNWNGKGWLKEVTVKGYKRKPAEFDEQKRMSNFSHIVTYDQFKNGGYNSIGNSLLMVPGVHFKSGYLVFGGGSPNEGPGIEPLLVVDGVPLDQGFLSQIKPIGERSPVIAYLNTFNPEFIDFIEVLTGPEAAAYGIRGGNGVILVNTRNTLRQVDNNSGRIEYKPKGFHNPSSFVAPDYSQKEIRNSPYPDLRSTLYWNGGLLTNSDGRASVSFYTSDSKTTYTVMVTGITQSGELIYEKSKINRN